MAFPPGTAVQVTQWLPDMSGVLHRLAPHDGQIMTVLDSTKPSAVKVAYYNDTQLALTTIPNEHLKLPRLTFLVLYDGYARINQENLKTAFFNTFGDPTQWDHGPSLSQPPLQAFLAQLDVVLYPGESLDAYAWRLAIVGWRGSRKNATHPIPTIQIRAFTDHGTMDEKEHGEWMLDSGDLADMRATFPDALPY
jgi:hypothetical protein